MEKHFSSDALFRAVVAIFGYTVENLIMQEEEIFLSDKIKQRYISLRDGFFPHPTFRYMGEGTALCYGLPK